MTRVAINGMGRIGRAAFKIVLDTPELELVAVNDLVPPDNIAYLLRYDSVYGRYPKPVEADDDLIVDGRRIKAFQERDPTQLPWGKLGIDIVFECTGVFTRLLDLKKHIEAGAQYVILSAPSKDDEGVPTVVHGVNRSETGVSRIISCASCTTNCITPVIEVIGRRIGFRKAILTTLHAYTASQALVDGPSKKDYRAGRAAAANFIPASTGAAVSTTRALPQYEGLFDGVAVRAPLAVGSIADIVFVTSRPTTPQEVNDIFRQEAATDQYRGILGVADDPIVSSDIIQDPRASIIDAGMTRVVDGDLLKVMSWYDNEWGYTAQMVREAVALSQRVAA